MTFDEWVEASRNLYAALMTERRDVIRQIRVLDESIRATEAAERLLRRMEDADAQA